jgi:hypothetical protein
MLCCVLCVSGDVDIMRVREDIMLLRGKLGHGYSGNAVSLYTPA